MADVISQVVMLNGAHVGTVRDLHIRCIVILKLFILSGGELVWPAEER